MHYSCLWHLHRIRHVTASMLMGARSAFICCFNSANAHSHLVFHSANTHEYTLLIKGPVQYRAYFWHTSAVASQVVYILSVCVKWLLKLLKGPGSLLSMQMLQQSWFLYHFYFFFYNVSYHYGFADSANDAVGLLRLWWSRD